MTVSLYSNEYVERIEEDRKLLMALLTGSTMCLVDTEAEVITAGEYVSHLNDDLPSRRGYGTEAKGLGR